MSRPKFLESRESALIVARVFLFVSIVGADKNTAVLNVVKPPALSNDELLNNDMLKLYKKNGRLTKISDNVNALRSNGIVGHFYGPPLEGYNFTIWWHRFRR